ncbi:PucR family transcriptional regulator [Anaerovoracaceae bacterium 41-7]|jgi:hypothetical protein|nr:PucR family transcriptional regulator [Emergencia sp.]
MLCTVQTLLNQPLFEDAQILAGEAYLDNIINRVSVFDCPVRGSAIDKNIIEHGDLFLSSLDQFIDSPEILLEFICTLIDCKCSALIVLDINASLITEKIMSHCNRGGLPIIMVDRDIPYAKIMDTINKLIVQRYYHALNGSKINMLKRAKLSDIEKLRILESINPKFEQFIGVINTKGTIRSSVTENELTASFMKDSLSAYIVCDDYHYFIFSHSQKSRLKKNIEVFSNTLKSYFSDHTTGVSMLHPNTEIDLCLNECEQAMNTAIFLHENQVTYDETSLLQLLMKLKDAPELYRYYDSMVSAINTYKSENNSTLFDTLRTYVRCQGSYQAAAEAMGQKETTIRYRIGRLRQILNLEDDIVQFHTCASVLVMIEQIMCKG